jgi:hypothetical protein
MDSTPDHFVSDDVLNEVATFADGVDLREYPGGTQSLDFHLFNVERTGLADGFVDRGPDPTDSTTSVRVDAIFRFPRVSRSVAGIDVRLNIRRLLPDSMQDHVTVSLNAHAQESLPADDSDEQLYWYPFVLVSDIALDDAVDLARKLNSEYSAPQ